MLPFLNNIKVKVAVVLSALLFVALKVIFFLQQAKKAKLTVAMADDDVKDEKRKADMRELEARQSAILASAEAHEKSAADIASDLKKVTALSKRDQKVIEDLKTWSDVDAKVKERE